MKVNIGDTIRIDYMEGEPHYTGKVGTVTYIDDIGQIHGTWGGCAVCSDYGDEFTIIKTNWKYYFFIVNHNKEEEIIWNINGK